MKVWILKNNRNEGTYPKIKKRGVLGGHDIDHDGVTKAFVEFMIDKDSYFIKGNDWWVIKEKKNENKFWGSSNWRYC